ncbi:hypothetical protein HYH03_011009 [Edaphochlamys debaryana]|uniref:ABC transporter domain-containing protein n=1 Tax=Edaphochlamys debaryana TaxID=47281 RepID=A0A836BW36_9CHLO|nr:hypothetical protein HYH03_011009 [Edaphochlamys debaryana]|eukprot:KAG2490617.1 hypothetical protein HYH03_011009 [Edaphochlamys debaryana]
MSAGFGAQANALLRKSAVYQKRNVRTNICLLSSPIFFCLILLFIKILVNRVFLTGVDFECGCQCVQCCKNGNCESLKQGYCDEDYGWKCNQYNTNNCGPQYSSPQQASFCEIRDPSTWPPVLQVPRVNRRAPPAKPGLTVLMTSEPGSFQPPQLMPYVMQMPQPMDNDTFLNVFLPNLITVNGTVNGHLFTQYGYTFGTSATGGQNQYIERAFAGPEPLNFLLPTVSGYNCTLLAALANATDYGNLSGLNTTSATGPSGLTVVGPVDLVDILIGVVWFTSGTRVTEEQIDATLGSRPVLADFLYKDTLCSDALLQPVPNGTVLNDLLYCGYTQARCNGTPITAEFPPALEFDTASTSAFSANVYYNRTFSNTDDNGPQSYIRVQQSLSSAAQSWWGVASSSVTNALASRLLGVMSMPKSVTKLELDFSSLLGPLFYTWVVQMLLPTFLQQLVYEKEKRLRMMMKMHGLGDGAYWLITYLWYLMLYVLYMAIFLIFGAGVGLDIFRKTSIGIQIVFYLIFGNNMIAFAFMLSSLFSSSRTSTVVAFIYVFATGLIGELLLKVFMEKDALWVFFIQWIPAFALYRGIWEMAEYAFIGSYMKSPGLTWAKLGDPGNGMGAVWGILAVEWFVFMGLGWYLEQVLSNGNGIRRHPLFFLPKCCRPGSRKHDPLHGSPRGSIELRSGSRPASASLDGPGGVSANVKPADGAAAHDINGGGGGGSGAVRLVPGEREDVMFERMRVEGLSAAEEASLPIVVKDLRKVFPPQDGGKPKVAVRTLTLAIERGECFGLLGPNGAGKSTSINMLTGFMEPTSGTAAVEGFDIKTHINKIYRKMGVCPQHDLLWDQLTGEEHLLFYGRLKGLKGEELTSAVASGLKSVNLFANKVGEKQSQKYSGGMKRRLSVAISFIGAPAVVYLDEPSTGLDPASRRNLWDVVRRNKASRAIILTTHSMEEAEILCDRLGIFVDGQLVCVGAPREITARYAGYLVFTITVAHGHEDAAAALVRQMSPNARLTYHLGSTSKYELPTTDVTLAGVFDAMAAAKQTMQVLDWGVANATLEEVFIKFAREIGAETKDN